MELDNLLSAPQVRTALRRSDTMATKKMDLNKVVKLLIGLKGLTVSVQADESLNGILHVDFSESTAGLLGIAKPLVLEALDRQGLAIEDLKQSRETVSGTSISLQGKLSKEGMRTLLSLVAPPANSIPATDEENRRKPRSPRRRRPSGPNATSTRSRPALKTSA